MPPGIRNRFTEFFVDEMDNPEDLKVIVMAYLKDIAAAPPVADVVDFYLAAKELAATSLTGKSNSIKNIICVLTQGCRWSQSKATLQFAYIVACT